MRTPSLFESERLSLPKAIELSVESLRHYGEIYKHWSISFSGGKDSTATVTLIAHLIETGQIPRPESLTVLYADTRQELPPLHNAALEILAALRQRGFETRVLLPALDHRYFVYMLGRGVPPPSNTFRWCTPKLKVMSMERELGGAAAGAGREVFGADGRPDWRERCPRPKNRPELYPRRRRMRAGLVSAVEFDSYCRYAGPNCTLAGLSRLGLAACKPTLSWAFPTFEIAKIYGQDVNDGEEPLNARTGCIGCPLVQQDAALDRAGARPRMGLPVTADSAQALVLGD